jgi:hypothetical protein
LQALHIHLSFDRFLAGQHEIIEHLQTGKATVAVFPASDRILAVRSTCGLDAQWCTARGLTMERLDEGPERGVEHPKLSDPIFTWFPSETISGVDLGSRS